jgi:hypothetical protein
MTPSVRSRIQAALLGPVVLPGQHLEVLTYVDHAFGALSPPLMNACMSAMAWAAMGGGSDMVGKFTEFAVDCAAE